VGLLLALVLTRPVAVEVVTELAATGFLAGVVAPEAVRLAPPLVLPTEDVQAFHAALPGVLDRVGEAT
jgi:acetylornithine aminotransferase